MIAGLLKRQEPEPKRTPTELERDRRRQQHAALSAKLQAAHRTVEECQAREESIREELRAMENAYMTFQSQATATAEALGGNLLDLSIDDVANLYARNEAYRRIEPQRREQIERTASLLRSAIEQTRRAHQDVQRFTEAEAQAKQLADKEPIQV